MLRTTRHNQVQDQQAKNRAAGTAPLRRPGAVNSDAYRSGSQSIGVVVVDLMAADHSM